MNDRKQEFEEKGYVRFESLLSIDEVKHYQQCLCDRAGFDGKNLDQMWAVDDGVSKFREFWPLIEHPNLIQALKTLGGPHIRFTQHSETKVNHFGIGFHRDCVNRFLGVGPDWDERKEAYQVFRVAIYLSASKENDSGLWVIPGTHLYRPKLFRQEAEYMYWIKKVVGKVIPAVKPKKHAYTNQKADFNPPKNAVKLKTNPGDIVIIDPRILHSGSPTKGSKYSIFMTYGVPSEHTTRHRNYYVHDHREKYGVEDYHPELSKRLRKKELLLV